MGTLFLRLLLETGPPFYMVIRATWGSSRLQGKGNTFISQSFEDPVCWSGRGNRTFLAAVKRSIDGANPAAVKEVNVIDVYEFQYDGSTSDPFPIKSRVKQGCALAPTLFGVIFSLLLSYAFSQSEDGVYLHTRSDGHLFNLALLRAKTKVRKVLIRELLFADDPALTAHAHWGCFKATYQLLRAGLVSPTVSRMRLNDYSSISR